MPCKRPSHPKDLALFEAVLEQNKKFGSKSKLNLRGIEYVQTGLNNHSWETMPDLLHGFPESSTRTLYRIVSIIAHFTAPEDVRGNAQIAQYLSGFNIANALPIHQWGWPGKYGPNYTSHLKTLYPINRFIYDWLIEFAQWDDIAIDYTFFAYVTAVYGQMRDINTDDPSRFLPPINRILTGVVPTHVPAP